jgi:hypothetical protein
MRVRKSVPPSVTPLADDPDPVLELLPVAPVVLPVPVLLLVPLVPVVACVWLIIMIGPWG